MSKSNVLLTLKEKDWAYFNSTCNHDNGWAGKEEWLTEKKPKKNQQIEIKWFSFRTAARQQTAVQSYIFEPEWGKKLNS